ncbi:hypothetical protein EB796_003670 [Bugula neritina]|uniref:Uncharacterized protein n=1 Tax=Bugula neritina TaxID=10212 RepID=A0A7J7KJH1_BUGNE|nr:hypothetical protein EB796_003670 [Bugula neritina]
MYLNYSISIKAATNSMCILNFIFLLLANRLLTSWFMLAMHYLNKLCYTVAASFTAFYILSFTLVNS